MAVKLGHGVAISCDSRVIRHCTSASHPDGMERGRVNEVKDSHFKNHLYGTFNAAKEKIVRMGRAVSVAKHQALSLSSGGDCGPVPWAKKRRKTRRQEGRKSRKNRRGQQVDTGDSLKLMLGVGCGDSGKRQVLVLLVRVNTTAMEWIPVMARTRWLVLRLSTSGKSQLLGHRQGLLIACFLRCCKKVAPT